MSVYFSMEENDALNQVKVETENGFIMSEYIFNIQRRILNL